MQCSLSPPARGERLRAAPRRSSGCGGVQGVRRRRLLPSKNGSVDASEATTPRRAAHAAHIPSARAPCARKPRRHFGAAHTALVTTADRPLGCPGPLQGPGSPSDRHVCAPPPLQPPRARPPPWGPPTQRPSARVWNTPFCTLRRRRSTAAAAAAAAAAEAVDTAAPLPECKGRGQRSRRRFGGWSAALRTRRKRRRGPWVTAAAAARLGSCEGVKYAGPGADLERGRGTFMVASWCLPSAYTPVARPAQVPGAVIGPREACRRRPRGACTLARYGGRGSVGACRHWPVSRTRGSRRKRARRAETNRSTPTGWLPSLAEAAARRTCAHWSVGSPSCPGYLPVAGAREL